MPLNSHPQLLAVLRPETVRLNKDGAAGRVHRRGGAGVGLEGVPGGDDDARAARPLSPGRQRFSVAVVPRVGRDEGGAGGGAGSLAETLPRAGVGVRAAAGGA